MQLGVTREPSPWNTPKPHIEGLGTEEGKEGKERNSMN